MNGGGYTWVTQQGALAWCSSPADVCPTPKTAQCGGLTFYCAHPNDFNNAFQTTPAACP
jgi:hypothetical protein